MVFLIFNFLSVHYPYPKENIKSKRKTHQKPFKDLVRPFQQLFSVMGRKYPIDKKEFSNIQEIWSHFLIKVCWQWIPDIQSQKLIFVILPQILIYVYLIINSRMISIFLKFTNARFMAQDVICPGEVSVCTWEKGEIHCFGVKCPIAIN